MTEQPQDTQLPNNERRRSLAKRTFEQYVKGPQKKIEELQDELTHDSHFPDMLNFKGFEQVVERQVQFALRAGTPMAFAFIDMDKMKAVNDKHGHTKGDEIIELLYATLNKYFKRESDIKALDHETTKENQGGLARRGGDEFLLALPFTNLEDATKLLEEARLEFEEEAKKRVLTVEPSFSFGVANIREKLKEDYNRDLVEKGDMEVGEIMAIDAEPAYVLISAVEVAEMRMYQNKIERGLPRE